ncbi:RhoGAP-domain-containing protein [Anaeromyces robustus]|uniref:RhoGAP-domain-containing protein n=1 Tax=Anaeromyces robustus TaxID=1754192 RepID=A0A1Y1XC58_9FUNG|nr:RhoGAP-domain-containing protein [Anaeromyces robustus]|eukprot:ORX83350.1 RhoGAP-domain-containing protein [Anaeromyces robustus]
MSNTLEPKASTATELGHKRNASKPRPLSSSFNEISRGNSIARKDHELHYLKSYTSLTEYELIILRKTAFTNIRNQFRALNGQRTNNNEKTEGNASTENHQIGNIAAVSISGSFSGLSHHNHNTTPGKDFRESIIKTLENINRGRTAKKWKIFTKKDKKRAVFGVPLVNSLEYAFVYIDPSEKCSNKKIPIVVYECINFLRKNGLSKEGIFRVNGSERRINNSLKIFNETAGYGFGYDFDGMNVFDVASLLKLYLRQLPEPLIPFCLYTTFLDVIKYVPDTYERIKAFQYLFMMLPSAHLILLEILLQFLSEIIVHFEENHMNAHNLACIFAPNLLRSKESSSTNLLNLSSSDEYEVALQVVEFLINHKDKFCITSPEIKPFQLFNKFEREALPNIEGGITKNTMEGMNSLSVTDFSTFQNGNHSLEKSKQSTSKNENENNNNNNKDNKDNKDNKEENNKKENNKKENNNSNECINNSVNNLQSSCNPISLSTSNMNIYCSSENSNSKLNESTKSLNKITPSSKENLSEKDADLNKKQHHPTDDNNNNNNNNNSKNNEMIEINCISPTNITYKITSSPSPISLTTKSKSNLESVRPHNEDSFIAVNTCPLVSTSLNRLNYLPIKNDDLSEYLSSRDNDNISPISNNNLVEKVKTDLVSDNNNNNKDSPSTDSCSPSSNQLNDDKLPSSPDSPMIKRNEIIKDEQNYPANVMNLPQKNRENSVISFLSPLSTPAQPIFSIPPPPTTPPMV